MNGSQEYINNVYIVDCELNKMITRIILPMIAIISGLGMIINTLLARPMWMSINVFIFVISSIIVNETINK